MHVQTAVRGAVDAPRTSQLPGRRRRRRRRDRQLEGSSNQNLRHVMASTILVATLRAFEAFGQALAAGRAVERHASCAMG